MQFHGAEQAARAILANTSPRYRRLEGLERWVDGTQYQGRPSWWDGGPEEAPLWERQPPVVYPVVGVAIRSNVDLVFGEGRFPSFTTRPGEDEADEENGLDETASDAVDRFLREYHKLCRFPAHCRDAFAAAQGCGTAVAIHGHRAGVPFADLVPAKWGTPKLGQEGETLEIEIRYPYLEELRLPDGTWAVKAKLYRRKIDGQRDTTYLPADAQENGAEPKWQPDPRRDIAHGLGFCPVIWYPFMRGCAPVNVIDGEAVHAKLTDEIQAHDIAMGQKHRCTLYAEPQPCEIGVDPGHNPTGSGRDGVIPATERGGDIRRGDNVGENRGGFVMPGGTRKARKKGPGHVWQYPSPDTKVEYLSMDPGVLKAMEEHCMDLLSKVEDGLCVVLPKPAQFKFATAISGKAQQQFRMRQYERCDQYRDDLWNGFLLPSLNMQLRIAAVAGAQLKVPGAKLIAGIMRNVQDKTDAAASAA